MVAWSAERLRMEAALTAGQANSGRRPDGQTCKGRIKSRAGHSFHRPVLKTMGSYSADLTMPYSGDLRKMKPNCAKFLPRDEMITPSPMSAAVCSAQHTSLHRLLRAVPHSTQEKAAFLSRFQRGAHVVSQPTHFFPTPTIAKNDCSQRPNARQQKQQVGEPIRAKLSCNGGAPTNGSRKQDTSHVPLASFFAFARLWSDDESLRALGAITHTQAKSEADVRK